MSFQIGDRVQKFTGSYTAFGEVRAVYTTKRGDVRYVVEVEPQGFQMIWGDKELRAVKAVQPPPAFEVSAEVRAIPVTHLDFNIRIRNVLENEGIKSVGELLDYHPANLMGVPNLGKVSLSIVRAELAKLGIIEWPDHRIGRA